MEIMTHQGIDRTLCGAPLSVKAGASQVTLTPTADMTADDSDLVHGGFVFGMADYAAMIAVNHPHVVLGGADVKFLKPVKLGETLIAEAEVGPVQGRKYPVSVVVKRDEIAVFSGTFTCFVLDKHVLA